MAQLSGNRPGISEGGHIVVFKTRGSAFISDSSPSWTDGLVFHFRKIAQGIEKTCGRQGLEAVGCYKGATIANERDVDGHTGDRRGDGTKRAQETSRHRTDRT